MAPKRDYMGKVLVICIEQDWFSRFYFVSTCTWSKSVEQSSLLVTLTCSRLCLQRFVIQLELFPHCQVEQGPGWPWTWAAQQEVTGVGERSFGVHHWPCCPSPASAWASHRCPGLLGISPDGPAPLPAVSILGQTTDAQFIQSDSCSARAFGGGLTWQRSFPVTPVRRGYIYCLPGPPLQPGPQLWEGVSSPFSGPRPSAATLWLTSSQPFCSLCSRNRLPSLGKGHFLFLKWFSFPDVPLFTFSEVSPNQPI